VKPTSIINVLKTRVPSDFLEMNQKALQLGMGLTGAARA
ncbi:partial 2-oxoglutarate ferredoxin oxidoreductase subunit gamma, partial [uncultured bacterium]